VVRVANRDAIIKALNADGIGAGIHYPFAVHELKIFEWMGHGPGAFPVSEDWARRCLSLPIYAELAASDAERCAAALKSLV
jgi:dTDP-4-amino-4,6-dideoxygalactose transaminase